MKVFVVWQPMRQRIDSVFIDAKKALTYIEELNKEESLMFGYTIAEVELK